MCLAIPGKVLEIDNSGPLKMSKVDFGGIKKSVCVEWIDDVKVGEYVIVHVGCAISKMDEQEAHTTLTLLQQMGDLSIELGPEDAPEKGR
jgi:hydrogenase expression/formation protein HypC